MANQEAFSRASREFFEVPHMSHMRADGVAGHVGLELRNVVANYPFERSHKFAGIQPKLATETIRV